MFLLLSKESDIIVAISEMGFIKGSIIDRVTNNDVLWIVEKGSYAFYYANKYGYRVSYEGINDWLNN